MAFEQETHPEIDAGSEATAPELLQDPSREGDAPMETPVSADSQADASELHDAPEHSTVDEPQKGPASEQANNDDEGHNALERKELEESAEESSATEEKTEEKIAAPAQESAKEESDTETSDTEAAAPEAAPTPEPLGGPKSLHSALTRRGFKKLTGVQQSVLDADDGARDLRISSRTGSGKTVALGFALLERLENAPQGRDRQGPVTLVVTPTRELAMQVKEELSWLFHDLRDIRCEVVTGGTNLDRERMRLNARPAVLVGTPGRLLDHIRRGGLDLSTVSQLVLDEADQMLDLGFKDELDGILEQLPEERRTHLVSATFPRQVLELADRFQRNPLVVEGTDSGEAHADIEHIACRVGIKEHYQALVNLLLVAGDERTLVFVRTREDTSRIADKLMADGFGAAAINGDLAQRQRTRTLDAFRRGTIRTLVATDVAARGIDVPDVTMVVHVELPIDSATYVHRSGRTGRAGRKGKSVLLVPKPRAGRASRLFHMCKIEPRWAWAPTPEIIRQKQLQRAEAVAIAKLDSDRVATPEEHKSAANLLQDRDPTEVVATLLRGTMPQTRPPFDVRRPAATNDTGPTASPRYGAQRNDSPRNDSPRFDAPRGGGDFGRGNYGRDSDRNDGGGGFQRNDAPRRDDASDRVLSDDRRAMPRSRPSWHDRADRPERRDDAPEPGFARFRINWGTRDGATARRILAHVCRRGDVDSRLVGSIRMDQDSSTFEVVDNVATPFARRTQRRDRRDPHLVIHRETFRA